jgi:hypothetical protein
MHSSKTGQVLFHRYLLQQMCIFSRYRSVRVLRWLIGLTVVAAMLVACEQPTPTPQPSLLAAPEPIPSPTATVTVPSAAPELVPRPTTIGTPEIPEHASLSDLMQTVSTDRLMADVDALSTIHSRHVNSPGIAQAADYIEAQFVAAGGDLQVAYQAFPLNWNGVDTLQRNVIATLPGSDPSAGVIVVGAHYDSRSVDINDSASRSPGANDNASGMAAVIELSRVLADQKPEATIIFVAFSAEEVGRQGSEYFVQSLSSQPDIRAVFVMDIIGRNSLPEEALRVYPAGTPDSPSRGLAEFFARSAEAALPGFVAYVQDTADRPHRYSDHISFSEAGYPALRLIQPEEDDWNHSGEDTVEKMTPEYLRRVTQAVLAAVYPLGLGAATR